MHNLIPPFLAEQTHEYMKTIPNGKVVRSDVIDADSIRIFYNNKDGRLESKIFPWIKEGAVTLTLPAVQEKVIVNEINSESFEVIK